MAPPMHSTYFSNTIDKTSFNHRLLRGFYRRMVPLGKWLPRRTPKRLDQLPNLGPAVDDRLHQTFQSLPIILHPFRRYLSGNFADDSRIKFLHPRPPGVERFSAEDILIPA